MRGELLRVLLSKYGGLLHLVVEAYARIVALGELVVLYETIANLRHVFSVNEECKKVADVIERRIYRERKRILIAAASYIEDLVEEVECRFQ